MVGKVKVERRQRLVNVCTDIIDGGPHNVDADIVARFKSAVLRYAGTQYIDTQKALENIWKSETEVGFLVRSAFEVIDKADVDAGDIAKVRGKGHDLNSWQRDLPAGDGDDGGGGGASDQHASRVADLLVEAGTCPDRATALRHLLHSSHGQALLSRLKKKEDTTMESTHAFIRKIVKTYGITGLCKHMAKRDNSFGLTEPELVEMITEEAQAAFPELTKEQAFAKFYTDGDRAAWLRQAVAIAKSPTWTRDRPYLSSRTVDAEDFQPTVISGNALRDQRDVDEAWDALCLIGARMAPAATPQQQFAVALEAPANASLAQRVHRRPSPSTVFPMPFVAQKAKRSSSEATAYDELMVKAEEYRTEHPELSVAQAFEKVFTAPANRELAKRERQENGGWPAA